MNKKNKVIIGIIIMLLIMVVGIISIYKLIDINRKRESYILSDFEQEVINVLTYDNSNSYFSTDNVVGASNPPGYIFLSNGKFCYDNGGYSPNKERQILSYRGNWKIKENSLVLSITEEIVASGGIIKEDSIEGNILTQYDKISKNVKKNYEYEIEKLGYDEIGRAYLKFKNSDFCLTKISISDTDFIKNMIEMANKK